MERVQALEDAHAEVVKLAVERRSRLEESRPLWQFYWDMAEEELDQGDAEHRAPGRHRPRSHNNQPFAVQTQGNDALPIIHHLNWSPQLTGHCRVYFICLLCTEY